MKALISPSENNRIAQVSLNDFPVAEPLYWLDCPDDCTTEWVYDGFVFNPAPVFGFTLEEQAESVRNALQSAIDVKARSFGFTGGNALMLYAGFLNPFQPLAQTFATWEASVWYEAELYKAEVIAGTKPMLSPSEAVSLMPAYPV